MGGCSSQIYKMTAKRTRLDLLSESQSQALSLARAGESFFLTGPAGTGKSHLLKLLVEQVQGEDRRPVALTSSTGTSAYNIGGITIYSFAGIGLGQGPVDQVIRKVRKNQKAVNAWRKTEVLVIEEISMISKDIFTLLDKVGRAIRATPNKPFGGLQVIAVGDFYQLPPVPDPPTSPPEFAFESPSWEETFLGVTIVLDQVYRQNDPVFIKGLHQLREGVLDPEFYQALQSRMAPASSSSKKEVDDVIPTHLYSLNREVDVINKRELAALQGTSYTYHARDVGVEPQHETLFPVGPSLTLKRGAQVVFCKNAEDYKNGTRGVVIMIGDGVAEEEEEDEAPPVTVQDTEGRMIKVQPIPFTIERDGVILASRTAMPLKLGWALTAHKSQGMTLDLVEVHLGSVFSPAQAYTALSRARSIEGLHVSGLSQKVVYCNEKVRAFYSAINTSHKSSMTESGTTGPKPSPHACPSI